MQLPTSSDIAADLRALMRGEVRFDDHSRLLYSTDASIYQVQPIGVVVPADADDVANVLKYCNDRRIAVLARGGGTSLAGQCTNRAVVIDLSALCRRVLSVEIEHRTCRAEAGITIDEINRQLTKTGLFYAPDPATSAQAALGGTIGNNAAGARSIRYGRTSENIAALDVILPNGDRTTLGRGAGRNDAIAMRLAGGVAGICSKHAGEIRARFPRTIRRNAGYGLDMILAQLDAGVAIEDLDLTGLVCGSEGTLAVVTSATLKLHPQPLARALAIVSFADLFAAIDTVGAILATNPSAVELIDEVVLSAASNNAGTRPLLELLPTIGRQLPRAVLYVEYTAEKSIDEIAAGFAALRRVLPPNAPIAEYRDADALGRAWTLRKAGEPLLHGIAARRKPQTFVEDNAIPVENLPRFVREFQKIVQRHGTTAAYWAHASVGVLHIRPMIDVHDERDRAIMRDIAVQVADLARECGGVMSGEHGDGRIRGPLLERFFGPAIMSAFRDVKRLFDPNGILNPGDIVPRDIVPGGIAPGDGDGAGAGAAVESITTHLRVLPDARPAVVPDVETFFDYTDQHGFDGAVEMCNGAGFCRKMAGGAMCPSYRATLDERHSTRGRGNALRMAITGQLHGEVEGRAAWNDPGTIETLDLCLSCKACKTECPSNVDIARLKAEYAAQRYRELGRAPLSARVFGNVRTLNRIGAIAPGVANWVNRLPPVRAVLNRALELAPQRSIPPFAPSLFRWFDKRAAKASAAKPSGAKPQTDRPVVVLFGDCFTAYSEPHIGRAAIDVLESLGYEVLLADAGCCGRAMISTGLLPEAISTIDRTIAKLAPIVDDPRVRAIVVAEPSCLSAIKDDSLQLKVRQPIELRKQIAQISWLIEDFVDRCWNEHPHRPELRAPGQPIVLHGHCHQKSLWGDQTSANALRRVAGDRVTVLPSGCCGMAGSFGYLAHRYDVSMKIGELSLFGPIRENPDAIVAAPGTSCRHQIKDGTGRRAVHPIELIAAAVLRS